VNRTTIPKCIVVAAATLLVAACGGDDDDSGAAATDPPTATADESSDEPTPTTEPTPATEAPAPTTEAPTPTTEAPTPTTEPTDGDYDVAVACDAWISLDGAVTGLVVGGQGDPDSVNAAFDEAIAAADPERATDLSRLQELAGPALADSEAEPPEELFALYNGNLDWAAESCPGVETLQVEALDYHSTGIPETTTTGYKVIQRENVGTEFHEMFTVRINDDFDGTIDDLLGLPEEEAFQYATPVNAGFAMPGATEPVSWNLTEPGRYAAFCFIPVGSTPDADESSVEGPPHFTVGMIHEFTVT
jgi:hypothetical protein